MLQPYMQIADPVAHSLALSAFFALLPLLVMFVLLGGLRWSPLVSGVWALIVAAAVAVLAYGMPVSATVDSALFGAAFSILNVIFIVINAIWIHNMLVKSGYFEVVRRTFAVVSSDLRLQAVLIAFCFGGLLEALAGAGTPIAIVAVMLVALGMSPLKAVVCALVADTAPVAFGALAVPIVTLSAVTGEPFNVLGAVVGRQTPVIAVVVPFVLVWIVDGGRGLKQTWPAALVAGLAFGIAQFVCSNYISVPLSDIVASLVGAAALVALLQVWKPSEVMETHPVLEAASAGAGIVNDSPHDSDRDRVIAFMPYLLIVAVFVIAQIPVVAGWLNVGLVKFAWPGLAIHTAAGKVANTTLAMPLISGAASLLLIAGILARRFCGFPEATR